MVGLALQVSTDSRGVDVWCGACGGMCGACGGMLVRLVGSMCFEGACGEGRRVRCCTRGGMGGRQRVCAFAGLCQV